MASINRIAAEEINSTFSSSTIDLISASLGGRIVSFSDEWFASAANLLTPTPPIRKPGYFVHTGAWYDGWETRRHNPNDFDWVIIRLGVASGRVKGVEIDTAYFNGNHAPEVEVQGVISEGDDQITADGFSGWETILSKRECGPSQRHGWELGALTEKAYTHVRLLMYPDGGIARFRLFGQAVPVFPNESSAFDLAAAQMGGRAVSCSDQHFGTKDNLLLPNRGKDMGDGWETKRTRGIHVDWVVVRLGAPGSLERIVIDTANFRGNFPKEVQLFAALVEGTDVDPQGTDESVWAEILKPQKAGPDKEHVFEGDVLQKVRGKTYSHVKLVIIPDGGVSRVRVFGRPL